MYGELTKLQDKVATEIKQAGDKTFSLSASESILKNEYIKGLRFAENQIKEAIVRIMDDGK
tara:strand:- start:2120 stop:2302 length:183 start_codon:yes stop_codon:yes gene_type:complete